jgi:hypothetical protein
MEASDLLIGTRAIGAYLQVSPAKVPALADSCWPIRRVCGRFRASKADLDRFQGRGVDKLAQQVDTMIGVLTGLRAQIDGLIKEFEGMREG